MNNVKGKLVFITGASNGIGKAIAIRYAQMGANLLLLGRNKNALEELKVKLENEYKIDIRLIFADVRNYKILESEINSLPEKYKKIDILINNAGLAIGLDKVYLNEEEDIDNVVDTNIKGVLYMTKLIVPLMLKYEIAGHIVNMGSIAGNSAYAGGAVYCGTKAAVKTISDGLRIDLVATPLKVTTILPGMVETDFSLIRFKGDSERAAGVYSGIEPLTADDVADTVIYSTNLPKHIQITDITLTPTNQADGRCLHKTSVLNNPVK